MTRYDQFCETVTAKIVAAIESNGPGNKFVAPWHRIGMSWAPRNAKTAVYYSGSNVIALASEAMGTEQHLEWSSPWWATYKQWADIGGQVRKGERSTPIVKWVRTKPNDDGDRPKTPNSKPTMSLDDLKPKLIPKIYGVFNVAQIDGWQPPTPTLAGHAPLAAGEAWIEASGAAVSYGHDHACYLPTADRIEVPALGQYNKPVDHYATVCHELIHWTGHTSRLARTFGERFGDDAYAAEELVAELGAAFSCARLGLTNEPRDDHATYLAHWLRILKTDPKALFTTASAAQKATSLLAANLDNLNDNADTDDGSTADGEANRSVSKSAT